MMVKTFMTPLVRKECQERTSISRFPLWLDIVSALINGRTMQLSAKLPRDWADQRTLLGQVCVGEPYRVGVSYPR